MRTAALGHGVDLHAQLLQICNKSDFECILLREVRLLGSDLVLALTEFKRLLLQDEVTLAKNMTRQLLVYATGSPVRFSDRAEIDRIVQQSAATHYGLRTLVHQIVQSDLFLRK